MAWSTFSSSLRDQQQVRMKPKYKSLGRVNVEEHVTVKLISGDKESSNYSSWRPQMETLINSHQLSGLINGKVCPPFYEPTCDDGEDYDVWMGDKVVKRWFLCTILEPTLIGWVSKCVTARQAWLALEHAFHNNESQRDDEVEDDEFRQFKFRKASVEEKSSIGCGVNVANFVPDKLQWLSGIADTNYVSWKRQMLCLITSHGLLKYIDVNLCGISMSPRIINDVWIRNHALVKGWILSSITPQIASSLWQLKIPDIEFTAAAIWEALERKFGIGSEAESGPNDEHSLKCVKESTLLHKAALYGDWEAAQQFFSNNPEAIGDWIDGNKKSRVLDIAIQAGDRAVEFVRNLVQNLSAVDLVVLTDGSGGTALHTAAAVGNEQAAEILVDKAPDLCYMRNDDDLYPVHIAAVYAQREVLNYLILKIRGDYCYQDYQGQQLLNYLIQAKFYDIAIHLTEDHPCILETIKPDDVVESPLTLLTKKINGLSPKTNFKGWKHLVFLVIEKLETTSSNRSDIEAQSQTKSNTRQHTSSRKFLWLKFYSNIRKFIEFVAPELFKKIKEYQQARQLSRIMCEKIESMEFACAEPLFREAIFVAAELGVQEVAKVIIDVFPGIIYSFTRPSGQHVFHKAILNRSFNVFKLIYDLTSHKTSSFSSYMEDKYRNNPLHLAAKLAPPHKLQESYGAALQMRHEMLWFMEVEEIVNPYCAEQENDIGKTPKMVFVEEHKDLKIAGEKWMKETANSYVLVAVLIATVMFTGAITVPGGNDDKTGFPVLSGKLAFTVFVVSDTISLIASISSLLSFLAILTSRYAKEDFLHSLPWKLTFGLVSLFISIMSMMVSFIATIYLVFEQKKKWFMFPLLMYACVPVALFTLGQYRLLLVLIRLTYDRRVF